VHPTVVRVAEILRAAGASGEPVQLEDSARTAAEAAAALGCDVGAIASSLVFTADGEPLLIMTSGGHRVDTELVGDLLGARIRRADADVVRTATGYAIGGVAPVGHPAPLRTLVDEALGQYDVVWAAAGHPHAVFPTTFDELVRITGGTPARVGP
jgi:prolyl-tRNA editing enzyme YbaK/EbsC (Cys-tRNA(Pro) deacylase)